MSFSNQIREYIIAPSLRVDNLWSESAEILVYGTGMVESQYQYITQIGNPADGGLGFWQMEPSDYKDLCKWLNTPAQNGTKNNILACCYFVSMPVDPNVLISNIKLASLLCRAHYLRCPAPLPSASSAQDFANYHKTYYNTALGAADADKNAEIFQEIIDGKL